jgi:Lipase (class 3)/Subtilase family
MPFPPAFLQEGSLSWHAVYGMALCSDLSYEPKVASEYVTIRNWGFDGYDFIESGKTQSFIVSAPDVIVVSFRSTESFSDWVTNLQVTRTHRHYGTIHKGLCESFESVRDAIRDRLTAIGIDGRSVLFTGHGLGGALATIAIADFAESFPDAVSCTFGQPRLGKANFAEFAAAKFGDRMFRVVNDDDIVARTPPGYEHVGQLLLLDENANMRTSVEEAVRASTDSPPLTEEEFQELRQEILTVQQIARSAKGTGEAGEATVEATIEGLFPSFTDHRMDHYISKVRRLAFETPQLDGVVELARQFRSEGVATEAVRSAFSGTQTSAGTTPLLIRLRGREWNPPAGLKIQSQIGNFVTAKCSDEQLELLLKDPQVLAIERSPDAGIQDCGVSMPFVGAPKVQQPPIGERGDQALVGIIDSGIDVLHEAFRDNQGNSRILAIWNQQEAPQAGITRSPHQALPEVFTQDYGVLYRAESVQAMVNGMIETPHELRDPDTDELGKPVPGHGTHVSSIAAGRPIGTFAGGVAPEAKLIVVIPKITTKPGDPISLGYSNSHVDALSFLYAAAKSEAIGAGLPMAVNVSLGMNAGAHDGLSTLKSAFDAATNLGRLQGFVIVKSAGNEGDTKGHAEIRAMHQGITEITWDSLPRFRQRDLHRGLV